MINIHFKSSEVRRWRVIQHYFFPLFIFVINFTVIYIFQIFHFLKKRFRKTAMSYFCGHILSSLKKRIIHWFCTFIYFKWKFKITNSKMQKKKKQEKNKKNREKYEVLLKIFQNKINQNSIKSLLLKKVSSFRLKQ